VRDAEELHDALLTLIALAARGRTSTEERNRLEGKLQESLPAWAAWFEHLVEGHRAVRARAGEETYWVATERIGASGLSSRSSPRPSSKRSRSR